MKTSLSVICMLMLSMVLSGCATHEQKLMESKAKYMEQGDLQMFFAQPRDAEFVTARGGKGKISYYPDGKMHVMLGDQEDDGEYSLRNGQFCSTWQTIRKGEKCTKLYKVAGNVYENVTMTGAYDATLTFAE